VKPTVVFVIVTTLFAVVSVGVTAQSATPVVVRNQGEPLIFDVREYNRSWILGDTSGDGRTDYALQMDSNGRKKTEAVDHNNDGFMDNFYFYENGVLHMQKLDTNHDGQIDLWIFMHRGVYIREYHRDTNHDGTVDLVRSFGES
jgi:hypothetical protein